MGGCNGGKDSPGVSAQRSDSFNSGQAKYQKEAETEGKERRRIRRAWAPSPSISSSEQSLIQVRHIHYHTAFRSILQFQSAV